MEASSKSCGGVDRHQAGLVKHKGVITGHDGNCIGQDDGRGQVIHKLPYRGWEGAEAVEEQIAYRLH